MTAELCRTFQELAAQTWQRIAQADETGLFWSEETNTETLLMELRARHPKQVIVRAFDKGREARNGADWEWWLGAPGSWFGMRVQAKRIKLPAERFIALHRQKAKKQPKTQIETLIEQAFNDELTPAYCLYVHTRRWPKLSLWAAPHLNVGEASPLGCLVAHAAAVRDVGAETLSKLAPVSVPWHLLVCQCAVIGDAGTTAGRAHALLRYSSAASGPAGHFCGAGMGSYPLFPPRSQLPDYLAHLLPREYVESVAVDHNGEAQKQLASVAANRKLAGFVVMSAAPLGG